MPRAPVKVVNFYKVRSALLPRGSGLFVEYSGLVTSESQRGRLYYTKVRLVVTPTLQFRIMSWSCECRSYIFGRFCKHVKALINKALGELRGEMYAPN
jgi:SWIM zinc finger.